MPLGNLRACTIPDAMKSEQKAGKPDREGHDSLDNFIRQAIGKEPFLSFSRADLPGWPLLSPSKVQMQKCDKCSRDFCSPINYRRHIRVHRRSLNIDKDSPKNRGYLGAFWDKLSFDEAKEVISFKTVALEEVAGSSIIRALTSFVRKPVLSSLPQNYIKAGAALLDVVQAKSPRFPISSKELFMILDDASESTFLCAGTAFSMQKFIFDGEAGKIALEMRNLVACTSFLVEQKLVKAWLADKDAEALRCQKLLVEEEEAAQKRQVELLEKKRLKKLRQKEQKAKEQAVGDKVDLKEALPVSVNAESIVAETSSPHASFEFGPSNQEAPSNPVQFSLDSARSPDVDAEANLGCNVELGEADMDMACPATDLANCQNVDLKPQRVVNRRQPFGPRWPKLPRTTVNGFLTGQAPVLKSAVGQKQNSHRDQKAAPLANGHKVWTRKTKPEGEREDVDGRVQREAKDQPMQNENSEVLIGSISVILLDSNGRSRDDFLAAADHQLTGQNNAPEKSSKLDFGQNGAHRSTVKLWKPVGVLNNDCIEGGGSTMQGDKREAEVDEVSGRAAECVLADESCSAEEVMVAEGSVRCKDSVMFERHIVDQTDSRLFSSHAAEAFLAQRWKEAMAADHVKLVLSEPSDGFEVSSIVHSALPPPLDSCGRSVLGNAENRLAGAALVGPVTTEASKPKFRLKPEKGSRLKYIPKQRNIA